MAHRAARLAALRFGGQRLACEGAGRRDVRTAPFSAAAVQIGVGVRLRQRVYAELILQPLVGQLHRFLGLSQLRVDRRAVILDQPSALSAVQLG